MFLGFESYYFGVIGPGFLNQVLALPDTVPTGRFNELASRLGRAKEASEAGTSQRAQYPLIKECSLNHNMNPLII